MESERKVGRVFVHPLAYVHLHCGERSKRTCKALMRNFRSVTAQLYEKWQESFCAREKTLYSGGKYLRSAFHTLARSLIYRARRMDAEG
jgi:hypothetical protein